MAQEEQGYWIRNRLWGGDWSYRKGTPGSGGNFVDISMTDPTKKAQSGAVQIQGKEDDLGVGGFDMSNVEFDMSDIENMNLDDFGFGEDAAQAPDWLKGIIDKYGWQDLYNHTTAGANVERPGFKLDGSNQWDWYSPSLPQLGGGTAPTSSTGPIAGDNTGGAKPQLGSGSTGSSGSSAQSPVQSPTGGTQPMSSFHAPSLTRYRTTLNQNPFAQAQAGNVQSIMNAMRTGVDSANKAGLARYKELMGDMDNLNKANFQAGGAYDQAEDHLKMFGQSASRNVMEDMQRAMAMSEQDLISRGLGNTTVRSSAQRGIRSDAQRSLADIMERVGVQRSGLAERRAGAYTDFTRLLGDTRLSRDDSANTNMYLQLLQAMM